MSKMETNGYQAKTHHVGMNQVGRTPMGNHPLFVKGPTQQVVHIGRQIQGC